MLRFRSQEEKEEKEFDEFTDGIVADIIEFSEEDPKLIKEICKVVKDKIDEALEEEKEVEKEGRQISPWRRFERRR